MRYIRTRSGRIFNTVQCYRDTSKKNLEWVETKTKIEIYSYDILKTSDNLIDLFDYIIYTVAKGGTNVQRLTELNLSAAVKGLQSGHITKAHLGNATDNGIIYFADLNKEGEVELR